MNLFSRNKESSDPAIIIDNCLRAVVNRISDDLDGEGYDLKKPWGVKRFESIVLAKFLINHAFNHLSKDKLKDNEKIGFVKLFNSSFTILFNDEFSGVGISFEDVQEQVQKKIDGYIEARQNNKPPKCWYVIYQQILRSNSKEEIEEEVEIDADDADAGDGDSDDELAELMQDVDDDDMADEDVDLGDLLEDDSSSDEEEDVELDGLFEEDGDADLADLIQEDDEEEEADADGAGISEDEMSALLDEEDSGGEDGDGEDVAAEEKDDTGDADSDDDENSISQDEINALFG